MISSLILKLQFHQSTYVMEASLRAFFWISLEISLQSIKWTSSHQYRSIWRRVNKNSLLSKVLLSLLIQNKELLSFKAVFISILLFHFETCEWAENTFKNFERLAYEISFGLDVELTQWQYLETKNCYFIGEH